MEEKYTYEEKQLAIQELIKYKSQKSYMIQQCPLQEIQTESTFCLYCQQKNKTTTDLFCSLFCKEIFNNNLIPIIKNNSINCIPFELLTHNSKILFQNFISSIDFNYNKILLYFSIKNISGQFSDYFLKCKFIYNFDIVQERIITLQLKILNLPSEISNYNIECINKSYFNNLFQNLPLNKQNLDETYLTQYENTCLYCHQECNKKYFIILDKYSLLGCVCSSFCYKVFLSNNTIYINYPYSFFYKLPNILYFKNKEFINIFKNTCTELTNHIYQVEIKSKYIKVSISY